MNHPSALFVGFTALDVILYEGRMGHAAGGTAANVAANLAYLGWQSSLIGVLGDDEAGRLVVSDLARSGVNVDGLRKSPAVVTPVVIHEITPPTHRFRFVCPECGRRAARQPRPTREDARRLLQERDLAEILFIDRVSLAALELANHHHNAGKIVFFEPSGRGHPSLFSRLLADVDVIKYSAERAGAFEDLLDDLPPSMIEIVTNGASGTTVVHRGRETHVQGFSVDVIDSGGAGDWMTAFLLTRWVQGDGRVKLPASLTRSVRAAQAAAALSCRFPGARGIASAMTAEEMIRKVAILSQGSTPTEQRASSRLHASSVVGLCSTCLTGEDP